MRVLGIDLGLKCGNKNGDMAICTLDNSDGFNKIIEMHVGEVGASIDKIVDTLINIFEINGCDYLAIDRGGMSCGIAIGLKDKLGDKVKDISPNSDNIHEMIIMLQDDNVLERVGLKLSTVRYNGGKLKFYMDNCGDFEVSMIYSIALANRVLNIENKKNSILQQMEEVKETLRGLKKQLEELDVNKYVNR
ncbi:MAG: hypothetical protein ACRC18_06500 [Cetobacterium sp.]